MTAGYEAYSYLDQSPWPGPLAPEFVGVLTGRGWG
jgi:hypothetical protein